MAAAPTKIGIAVVEAAGNFLVGVRGDDGPLAGLAEFPGGKCLDKESSRECAVRECLEETGLRVLPVELLLNQIFTYDHGTVDLDFWLCRPAVTPNCHANCNGFRWIPADGLAELNFPEANQPVTRMLCAKAR